MCYRPLNSCKTEPRWTPTSTAIPTFVFTHMYMCRHHHHKHPLSTPMPEPHAVDLQFKQASQATVRGFAGRHVHKLANGGGGVASHKHVLLHRLQYHGTRSNPGPLPHSNVSCISTTSAHEVQVTHANNSKVWSAQPGCTLFHAGYKKGWSCHHTRAGNRAHH